MRNKIDYGIDLGTTNSAICRMEQGKPIIRKTDTLKDTMPSCVSFTRRKSTQVGDAAFNAYKSAKRRETKTWKNDDSNAFMEFKRTMATDTTYHSAYMNQDYTSEELSAEVVKTLKSFITDEEMTSAVITVPAKFTAKQKTATLESAKMAGLKKCELLQEPIAASMAYGLDNKNKDGIWMVFDFGGGTFDAALLKVEDGIMQVFDTEGDNYLGGKNLDYAIVDMILIPYIKDNFSIDSYLSDNTKKGILRDMLKTYAEPLKNQLSFKSEEDVLSNIGDLGEDEDGEELELDLTVTQDEVFNVIRPFFQKAIDSCKELLSRNNITGTKLDKLILVGGPTHSPLVKEMLREQITTNVDESIDPMTAVATGAALYASTIDAEIKKEEVEVGTVQLDIEYESTSVETSEWIPVKLPEDSDFSKVQVELTRSDKAWSSGKVDVDKKGNIIEVQLVESRPNSFDVKVYDNKGNILPCFPEQITIIQGSKVGSAPLPYNIGIATWNTERERSVFRMAEGLEKNKPVPAVGVINDLKTTGVLRPGVESDILSIPVYQVDDFDEAEGRPTDLYEYISDVIITGEDVDSVVADGETVNVTIKVGTSEQMAIEVYFVKEDLTVEKELDTSKKQSIEEASILIEKWIKQSEKDITSLEESGVDVEDLKQSFELVKQDARNSSEKKMVLQHLKEVMRKVEDKNEDSEWVRLEREIREEFKRLDMAQKELGNDDTKQKVESLRKQTDQVVRTKDVAMGKAIKEQITSLFISLTIVYQLAGFVNHYNENFNFIDWKDSSRARQLLNRGLEIISTQPNADSLFPIFKGVYDLLPNEEAKKAGGMLK